MHRFDGSRETAERDPRNDPRSRGQADGEVVLDRKPIVADRPHDETEWPAVPSERRRSERRRIERMGTDT